MPRQPALGEGSSIKKGKRFGKIFSEKKRDPDGQGRFVLKDVGWTRGTGFPVVKRGKTNQKKSEGPKEARQFTWEEETYGARFAKKRKGGQVFFEGEKVSRK